MKITLICIAITLSAFCHIEQWHENKRMNQRLLLLMESQTKQAKRITELMKMDSSIVSGFTKVDDTSGSVFC